MAVPNFPTEKFCGAVVRFLDALEYDDYNLTRDERISGLREVHTKTVEYFAQPLPQKVLADINPIRIATVSRTISHFVVYCWSYVPRDVMVDISIYLSIINVLDDEINADPAAQMATFWTDLLSGKRQSHPFWVLMQAHLPQLLSHYGSYCAFNFMRCTIDYFEGCWIEQHNFQGWQGADCYPMFMRRLNCLGGAVAGTIFPASGGFDDQKLFKEISIVMAQIDGPVALVNDLFSFYKEYDQDEPNLVSNWCKVDGITMDQALERLADEALHSCVRILELLKDKDPKVLQTIRGFIHGYVTWHFCELRYRVSEVHEAAAGLGPVGDRFREYYEEALRIGWVELSEWSLPSSAVGMDDTGIEVWEKGSHFKRALKHDSEGSSDHSDDEYLVGGSPMRDFKGPPRQQSGGRGTDESEVLQTVVLAPATQVSL